MVLQKREAHLVVVVVLVVRGVERTRVDDERYRRIPRKISSIRRAVSR